MSVRRLDQNQPDSFAFSPETMAWTKKLLAKYPADKKASGVIPLLWQVQKDCGGWLPEQALRAIAKRLDMAQIRVLEVATFYTMFNLSPVGKYYVQLCGTTPCLLRGSEELVTVCKEVIGPQNKVTGDGLFSWLEVECLGACANAPMVQINDDYFEDLTADSFRALLADLKDGKKVKVGPQNGRQASCPKGGPTTLAAYATSKGGK